MERFTSSCNKDARLQKKGRHASSKKVKTRDSCRPCERALIDPLLPREQAGFRRVRSTVDQVTLLTQSIENVFEAKKKAGAVFIDLTAAYDTVWHRGLTCKLLRLLPDKHMVRMIMELIRNRSFTLTTSDSKPSRLRRLRNGIPHGSVLVPSFPTSIHMISPP